MLIFGLGGGISLYEGVQHILHPARVENSRSNYAVLGAAALFDGASFVVSMRQFQKQLHGRPFWEALHASENPTSYTVLAEDSAALVGFVIAALGIALSEIPGVPELDGIASARIGLLLAGVAVVLVRESRGLLIGEGLRPATISAIRAIALAQPKVTAAGHVLSMYIGPNDVLVTMDVNFEGDAAADETSTIISTLEHQVRTRFPMIKRLFIEAGATPASSRPFP